MKRFILTLFSAIILVSANAQNAASKSYPKTIQVIGTAEMEIIPDEIHVVVSLTEYEKKGKPKTTLETIRKTFLTAVRNAGIADTSIKLLSLSGSSEGLWWKKKQKDELIASASYEIIFNDPAKIESLVELMDDDGTENFAVTEITHSRITAYQKQLRANALKAAKDKALFLASAIDESIGSAITITENQAPQYFNRVANTFMQVNSGALKSEEMLKPQFKKLVIKSEMNVVFELR